MTSSASPRVRGAISNEINAIRLAMEAPLIVGGRLMLPERAAHRRHANYAASAVPFAQQMPAVPQAFLLGRGLRGSNICGAQRVETWPGRAGGLDMANLRDE